MAKKGNKPRIDYSIPENRARLDMALVEVVRTGKIYPSAKKYDICHTTLERAWVKLTDKEREDYRRRAQDVCDMVVDHLVAEQVEGISAVNDKLVKIAGLATDELIERLQDVNIRASIKDSDLINILSKTMQLINESTKIKDADDKPERITNIFHIFDNSIQENIQQNHYNYEEE